jgi:hypothetical protein
MTLVSSFGARPGYPSSERKAVSCGNSRIHSMATSFDKSSEFGNYGSRTARGPLRIKYFRPARRVVNKNSRTPRARRPPPTEGSLKPPHMRRTHSAHRPVEWSLPAEHLGVAAQPKTLTHGVGARRRVAAE